MSSPKYENPPSSIRQIDAAAVLRAVTVNQLLFSAGNGLTTGAFLNYFLYQFEPSPLWLAAAQIAPETAQSLSACSRRLLQISGSRKRLWLAGLLGGRLAALCIPGALLLPSADGNAGPLMLVLVGISVWNLLQGMGFVNYISWLSDLVPEVNWGRLFSRRQLASLLIALVVPVVAGLIRQRWVSQSSPEVQRWSFAALFLAGGMLCMGSVIPLLGFPDLPWRPQRERRNTVPDGNPVDADAGQASSFRWLLATRWWLAFFQGLTQTALFLYSVRVLLITLPVSQAMTAVMVLSQIPLAWYAGKLCDQDRDRWGLAMGLLIAGGGFPLILLSPPGFPAPYLLLHLLWGAFGLVNVCGSSLCLKLSPRGDNTRQFALYDQVSGLVAGAAGLLGGALLSGPLQRLEFTTLPPEAILILISWAGRLTAALWLIPVRQPRIREDSSQPDEKSLPAQPES